MIVLLRKCKSCGMGVDISDNDHITVATETETMYFCKDCMYKNRTFQALARKYVLRETEERLGDDRK